MIISAESKQSTAKKPNKAQKSLIWAMNWVRVQVSYQKHRKALELPLICPGCGSEFVSMPHFAKIDDYCDFRWDSICERCYNQKSRERG